MQFGGIALAPKWYAGQTSRFRTRHALMLRVVRESPASREDGEDSPPRSGPNPLGPMSALDTFESRVAVPATDAVAATDEWLGVLAVSLPEGTSPHPRTFDQIEQRLESRFALVDRREDAIRLVFGLDAGSPEQAEVDCAVVAGWLLDLLGLDPSMVTEHRVAAPPEPTPEERPPLRAL